MTQIKIPFVLALALVGVCALFPARRRADGRKEPRRVRRPDRPDGQYLRRQGRHAKGSASSVAVKGDRLATLHDTTGQIIDLAEEKIYDIDMKAKSYRVTTFADLRRRMEEAQRKAQEERARAEKPAEKPQEPAPRDPKQPEVEVDFQLKETGQKKTVNGFDTREIVMTITLREKGKTLEQAGGLVLTSDMWMAPKVAGMNEIAEFYLRYAQTVRRADGGRCFAPGHGRRDGDVPDDDGGARPDEHREGEDGRHDDLVHRHARRGEIR